MKQIGDLFKLHTLWNEYIYVELLRPLTKEDFIIKTIKSKAVSFISEDTWEYKFCSNESYNSKDHYKAEHIIQLALCNELKETVLELRKNNKDISKYLFESLIFKNIFLLFEYLIELLKASFIIKKTFLLIRLSIFKSFLIIVV